MRTDQHQANEDHLDDEHYHEVGAYDTLVDGIGGTEPVTSDQTKEVLATAQERHEVEKIAKQLMKVLYASDKEVIRVVQAGTESIYKTVFCKANVPTKVSAIGYNRSRITIVGNNVDASIGTDVTISVDGLNSCRIGYAAGGVIRHEVRTYRDIWMICATDALFGIQEEFVA